MQQVQPRGKQSRPVPSRRLAALVLSAGTILAAPAVAAPAALVIGNSAYAYLPPVPGCVPSAHLLAAALRGAGFEVTEKTDLSSGALQAAIGDFARHDANAPKLIYFCGYLGSYNRRDFILPVSAALNSPPDLLAQGLLAKALVNVPGDAGGLVLLDGVPLPLTPPVPPEAPAQARTGLVMAIESRPTSAATSFAADIARRVAGAHVTADQLVDGLAQALPPGAGVQVLTVASPAGVAWNPPAPTAAAPKPEVPPAAPAQTVPPPAMTATPAPSSASPEVPDEDHMTPVQRRDVQIALAQLGYYDGRIDGVIGPETQSAIRRYQHELKQDMTGVLTSGQATRLLAGVR